MPRTNADRAARAEAALIAFVGETGDNLAANDLETWISDLLCDMRHFCDAMGVTFNPNAGEMNHAAEVEEDPAGDFCAQENWSV